MAECNITDTPHAAMIAKLRDRFPNVQVSGFFRALAGCGEYMADLLKHEPDWRVTFNVVPDAFAIDHDGKHVAVFEVVHTHDVSEIKLGCYAEIGWALDQDGYDIAIIRVDRYGATLIDPVGDHLASISTSIESEIERLGGRA